MKSHRSTLPIWLTLAVLSGLTATAAESAGQPFLPQPILPGGQVLALYPPDSPLLKRERLHEAERYNTTSAAGSARVQSVINIHNPSIEVHLAGGRGSNGAAVIVAPGGGHQILWVGPEGGDVVPYLANYGVSTIILRNRLRVDGYDAKVDAVNDAFQAIRLVRSQAKEWKLDPAKIGIMGFSAGAELAAPAALFFEEFQQKNSGAADALAQISARPDFVALVYPGPTPFTREPNTVIPTNVPPSFLVCAGSGDRGHAIWATDYFSAMLKAAVPNIEMHIYGNGGHGGSLKYRDGIPFGTWPERYMDWFRDLGFLQKPGVETKAVADLAAFAKKKATGKSATPKS